MTRTDRLVFGIGGTVVVLAVSLLAWASGLEALRTIVVLTWCSAVAIGALHWFRLTFNPLDERTVAITPTPSYIDPVNLATLEAAVAKIRAAHGVPALNCRSCGELFTVDGGDLNDDRFCRQPACQAAWRRLVGMGGDRLQLVVSNRPKDAA